VIAAPAAAERLPVRHYTVAEGLPHNSINAIYQDRRGYLWIGTAEGLARFDGQRFSPTAWTEASDTQTSRPLRKMPPDISGSDDSPYEDSPAGDLTCVTRHGKVFLTEDRQGTFLRERHGRIGRVAQTLLSRPHSTPQQCYIHLLRPPLLRRVHG
jgi:ligand-binding sensor domain-containing protein